jgi:mortality factor 4-like protein 1
MAESLVEEEDDDLPRPKFKSDDRVFCPEGEDNLYEAVVRKTSFKDGGWSYLVHFLGWNSRWDKWIPENDLRKATEELRRQALLLQEENKAKKVKQTVSDRKKRKRDDSNDSRGKRRHEGPSWEDYCELPFTLKTILVDDKDHIMRVNFDGPNAGVDCDFVPGQWKPPRDVHNLPASVTIKAVLNHFVKVKKKEAESAEAAAEVERKARSFTEGLSSLFEEALPVCLLYHPERAQYVSIESDPALKSLKKVEVYGCEFLLRLFVRLPILLEHSGPSDQQMRKEMGQHIVDLIVLLQKNRQACFKAKYREPRHEELNDFEKALVAPKMSGNGATATTTTTTPMEDDG